jgi:3-oxoacyl-[acyl-carrier protein] reductase
MDSYLRLTVGQSVQRSFVMTAKSVDAYAELTGDRNPVHMDSAYARAAGFRDRVVHGMYLAGLLSRIIGEDLPGHGALWYGQDLLFEEPVYVGDTITVSVHIVQMSPATRTISLEVLATDQNGNVKFKGKGKVTMPKQNEQQNPASRVALVTGGGGGIGSAICRTLSKAGAKVYIGYAHHGERAEQLAEAIKAEGGSAMAVKLDLMDTDGLKSELSHILSHEQTIDTIVCCAADEWRRKKFSDMTADDFRKDYDVTVTGHAVLMQALLPRMVDARFGRVIGVASAVVHGVPPAQQTSYVASKYAMVGLFRSLMSEYTGSGITFNLVSPSLVDTEFTQSLPERTRKAVMLQSPLGRLCSAQNVADVVGLLAHQESYVNGANIPVAGGINVG